MFIAINSKIFKILKPYSYNMWDSVSKTSMVYLIFFQRIFFLLKFFFINIDVGILGDNTGTCGMYVGDPIKRKVKLPPFIFCLLKPQRKHSCKKKSLLGNKFHRIALYTVLLDPPQLFYQKLSNYHNNCNFILHNFTIQTENYDLIL